MSVFKLEALPPTADAPFVGTMAPFRNQLRAQEAQAAAAAGGPTVSSVATAPEAAPQPQPYEPAPVPRTVGDAIISVVFTMVKVMPVLMVLGGGYYFYDSMFGKLSEDEMVAAGVVSRDGAPVERQSRAALMVNQTRSVVAAQSQHVSFANQLAELDSTGTLLVPGVDPTAPKPTTPEGDASQAAKPEPELPAVGGWSGDARTPTMTMTVYAPTGAPRDLVFTGPPASEDFVAWARDSQIAGVRINDVASRALINELTYVVGETIDRRLGIVFERVDTEARTLIFRDATGSVVAKPF